MSLALPAQVRAALAEGDRWGMEQHGDEISACACFMLGVHRATPIEVVLEIGVRRGGTAAVWHTLFQPRLVVGVDLVDPFNQTRRDELQGAYAAYIGVLGDSHDATTQGTVAHVYDFLFIDGDHSEAGCRQDYEMYAPLVRPGGWIAFHDIVRTPHMVTANCEVWRVWESLVGEKYEFVIPDGAGQWGGLGLLKVGAR